MKINTFFLSLFDIKRGIFRCFLNSTFYVLIFLQPYFEIFLYRSFNHNKKPVEKSTATKILVFLKFNLPLPAYYSINWLLLKKIIMFNLMYLKVKNTFNFTIHIVLLYSLEMLNFNFLSRNFNK